MSVLRIEPAFVERIEKTSHETLSLCYQCGTCTATCPMSVPVRGLLRSAQLGVKENAIGDTKLWYCATCKLCELSCPRGVKITDIIHALRIVGFEERKVPSKLESALWGVYEDANPWGGKKVDRTKWAEGLQVKSAKQSTKYLLYVGCATSFDPRLQKVARSLVQILNQAGIDFSILGDTENCCGDVVYQMGEEGFLDELISKNMQAFKNSGTQNIVSISPHCFNMFKNVYPKYGETPTVLHYTELLADILDKGILKPRSADEKEKLSITYHDPCYLGRYNGIYEQPRKILESIPGTTLVEMADTKSNALCCGGGGGQMWVETPGNSRPGHQRASQAAETGASIMATSCPYCIQNFEDGVRTQGISNLEVRDLAEILVRAVKK